jgi:integrase
MPRKAGNLSPLKVKQAKKPGRYPDGDGLYLQVGPNASKSWLLRFQLDGRERFMGLGKYPLFSLAEARDRASDHRKLLADGIDPIEARRADADAKAKAARENVPFRQSSQDWLALHLPTFRNLKHQAQWRSTLAQYALPKLGDRSVGTIDQAMINECVADIWHRTPETARRVKERIERIVQWEKDGRPLPGRNGNGKKHHAALPWQELPAFMAELRQRESMSARALEFTILTAARTGETIGATWDEIDLDKATWTIPAERMKANRPHRVPLSLQAVRLLKALPRERGNDCVFIGGKAGQGLSNMAMLELLKDLASGYTVHGFRATFKTWCDESQHVENAVVEAALAHVSGDKVEAAYRRGDMITKRAKLMGAWADYCDSRPADVPSLEHERAKRAVKQ